MVKSNEIKKWYTYLDNLQCRDSLCNILLLSFVLCMPSNQPSVLGNKLYPHIPRNLKELST